MNHRNINTEFEELKEKIRVLEEENKKLKAEVRDFKMYEQELKSQLISERCMKKNSY